MGQRKGVSEHVSDDSLVRFTDYRVLHNLHFYQPRQQIGLALLFLIQSPPALPPSVRELARAVPLISDDGSLQVTQQLLFRFPVIIQTIHKETLEKLFCWQGARLNRRQISSKIPSKFEPYIIFTVQSSPLLRMDHVPDPVTVYLWPSLTWIVPVNLKFLPPESSNSTSMASVPT